VASERETFEIQKLRQGRWTTEMVRDREEDARQLAKTLLKDKSCGGARVVRNWLHRDGTVAEKVVFEQTQSGTDSGAIRINAIEAAPPPCAEPRDYFGLESRMTINRILRTYLEEVCLTPTEVLHNAKELGRLRDKDTLVPSAVDRIASLQVRNTDISVARRREEIFAALDQIHLQARRADGLKLPKVGGSFSALLARMDGFGDEPPEYFAMIALSRELVGMRNWIAKLDRLCKLASGESDAKAVLLLDTVIADVLGANIVQEILGWQPSLGGAIVAMLDLANGKFDAKKSESSEVAGLLNGLLAQGLLPGSRHCIIDRALRQLRSSNALSRNEPAREMEEYQRVLLRLLGRGGLLAGPDAAEALTLRGARFVEQGGVSGRRAAINNTVNAFPDRAHGVMYLAELSKTSFADGHLDDIVRELDFVFSTRVIGELTRRTLSPRERLQSVTDAFYATRSSALPEDVKRQVSDHIDTVLERYLVDERVIERLDNPADPLRERAVRLVKFVNAGVLPEGKALARARRRIVELLRQPNFDTRFVAGLSDPVSAKKTLREFHQMLVKGGFV